MSEHEHDVVVVGAGIGGLTAGALLARRGLDVLVLERRGEPGGCCSSLRVDGYAFDIASSLFYGFGERGFNANRRVLDELGVELDLARHDPCYDLVLEGRRLPVHADQPSYLEVLGAEFPRCRAGLERFYRKIEPIYRDALAVGMMPVADANLVELARMAFHSPSVLVTYLPMLSRTLWSVLGPMLPDASDPEVRRLKALLDVDLAFGTCTSSDEVPLLLAVPILIDRHVGGVHYPMGGASAVPKALVRGLERHGGKLRLDTEVARIRVDGGRARGVELASGESISAGEVICNAGVWETFERLLAPAEISRSRRRGLARLEPSFSVVVTCVGVEAEIIPPGWAPHSVVIPDHRRGLADATIVYLPTATDPSLAPAGKHAVTLVNVAERRAWGDDDEPRSRVHEERLLQARERALELAERALPGLRARGEVKATLSPVWFEQTLRRRHGAVGGPAQNVAQSLHRRQGNRTEIQGLWLVGDSTFPGEGVVAVTISGLVCADQIRARSA